MHMLILGMIFVAYINTNNRMKAIKKTSKIIKFVFRTKNNQLNL